MKTNDSLPFAAIEFEPVMSEKQIKEAKEAIERQRQDRNQREQRQEDAATEGALRRSEWEIAAHTRERRRRAKPEDL